MRPRVSWFVISTRRVPSIARVRQITPIVPSPGCWIGSSPTRSGGCSLPFAFVGIWPSGPG